MSLNFSKIEDLRRTYLAGKMEEYKKTSAAFPIELREQIEEYASAIIEELEVAMKDGKSSVEFDRDTYAVQDGVCKKLESLGLSVFKMIKRPLLGHGGIHERLFLNISIS